LKYLKEVKDMPMKSISFLMPSHSKFPVGGFKVVYEYANRFIEDGYQVNIIYPATVLPEGESFIEKLKTISRYIYYKLNKRYTPYHWFELDKRVKTYWVPFISQKYIPQSFAFVATSGQTAECLDRFEGVARKIYFIQGYEVWWNGEDRFLRTLDLSLEKIVISPHLLKIVESRAHKADLILNGFDFNYFKLSSDIQNRNKYQVAMLYHLSPAKGCDDGLKAVALVKEKFPLLKLSLFGYPDRPKNLPSWIDYFQAPDKYIHNEIYNNASIFMGTSYSEGWGLTIGEAMICGGAVVCTNIDGYSIMARNEDTALLSPPGDYQAMAANIIRLIEHDELRFKLAKNGNANIKQYGWDDSYLRFKEIIA
jgi:glycosyltransferase involved in cell wall biosynthesis